MGQCFSPLFSIFVFGGDDHHPITKNQRMGAARLYVSIRGNFAIGVEEATSIVMRSLIDENPVRFNTAYWFTKPDVRARINKAPAKEYFILLEKLNRGCVLEFDATNAEFVTSRKVIDTFTAPTAEGSLVPLIRTTLDDVRSVISEKIEAIYRGE